MEFVSCILNDEQDLVRLSKAFTFIFLVLEHCNCVESDIMINLGVLYLMY